MPWKSEAKFTVTRQAFFTEVQKQELLKKHGLRMIVATGPGCRGILRCHDRLKRFRKGQRFRVHSSATRQAFESRQGLAIVLVNTTHTQASEYKAHR